AVLESGRLLLESEGGDGRSVSWVSLADLQETGAARLEDLFWQIAGADSPARFGVVTVPNLRGDAAESLFNGQRRGDNLFGLAPTLTLVESVEVVKGPPLIRTGPGKRTGGLLNLTTRQPVPGMDFGSLEWRLGTWVPGEDSYGTVEAMVDVNVPVAAGQALRFVAGIREDDTFYRASGGMDDYRDLLVAWRREGGDGARLDLLLYYLDSERPQTLGVNRPWQGLIDDGLYLTGGVSGGVIDPGLMESGPEDLVHIEPDRVLMSVGDKGGGDLLLAQGRLFKPLGRETGFEQLLLLEGVDREKYHAFAYAEEVEQLTIDSVSRLSGEVVNRWGELRWEAGLQLRLEERENRSNYWNEFAYAYDLTTGRRFSAYDQFPQFIAPGAVSDADGNPWYLPSSPFGTPESTDSRLRQAGIFGQARQDLAGGWSMASGARLDSVSIGAWEPGDLVSSGGWSDERTERLASFSVTLRRQGEQWEQYVSAGWYQGIAGNTVGDGINLYPPGELHGDDYRNHSRLIEWGGTWRPAGNLSLGWAVFDQRRQRREFFGPNDIHVRGTEVEAEWRPLDSTRIRFAGTFLDARYDDAAPAEFGGGSIWNVHAEGAGPTAEGNGLGYLGGFFANSLPPGDYRIPGLSRWNLGLGIRQMISESLQLHVWGSWLSRQNGNLAAEYLIPAQTEWNLSLLYSSGPWDFQLIARNLLDADNWIHNGDTFFDQLLVSRTLPLRLEGRVRVRF
ncbi:MAG: hypothetical protein ACP5I4_05885, partial [Oceanipulchritudo sp.]